LLFDAEASEHLSSSKAQNLSQRKLACCCGLIVHQAKHKSLFAAEASEHLSSSKVQNLSQRKLASEGNVDPSNPH
jgi:hypothetical protein